MAVVADLSDYCYCSSTYTTAGYGGQRGYDGEAVFTRTIDRNGTTDRSDIFGSRVTGLPGGKMV